MSINNECDPINMLKKNLQLYHSSSNSTENTTIHCKALNLRKFHVFIKIDKLSLKLINVKVLKLGICILFSR